VLAQLLRKLRHNNWPETTAEVEICKYYGMDNPENLGDAPFYAVELRYRVNGQVYESSIMSPVKVNMGDKLPIHYNPAHPERNSAEPYGDWEKYYDLVFVIVVVAGILAYYLTHRST